MKSIIQELGSVPFAPHTGERIYMREFYKADGLPFDLARWQPTVDAMLHEVDTDGPIYLMVDQGLVRAGVPHRRPGLHIDGYWVPSVQAHGGNGGGGRHNSQPDPAQDPAPSRGGHGSSKHMAGNWEGATFDQPEGIILASSVTASRALVGEFECVIEDGGACPNIDTSALQSIALIAGRAYAGNVTMLHESLPVPADCLRTVVRLNVPGWSPA